MEGAGKRAAQLLQNALAAMQASQVMLQHAVRKAKGMAIYDAKNQMKTSALAEDDPAKQYDMEARVLWGPWEHPEAPTEPYHFPREEWLRYTDMKHDASTKILTRIMERDALDKRAAEYLNLVEAQTAGPSAFSTAAAAALVAAAP